MDLEEGQNDNDPLIPGVNDAPSVEHPQEPLTIGLPQGPGDGRLSAKELRVQGDAPPPQ